MMLRAISTIVCVAGFLAAGPMPASPARAQAGAGQEKQGGGKNSQKPKGGGMKPKGKDKENLLQISGTVRQVSPQALVVEADDGARYLINAAGDSQVTPSAPTAVPATAIPTTENKTAAPTFAQDSCARK